MDHEFLSDLLNYALATSKLRSIKIPNPNEPYIRPNIHLLFYGAPGTAKSSITRQIAKAKGAIVQIGLTKAVLLGSVDSTTKNFIFPAVWDCRNSILVIDEFYVDSHTHAAMNVLRDLLNLTENPEYSKKFGYSCNDYPKEEDGDLHIQVTKNSIRCKTRFSLLINTMMDIAITDLIEVQALEGRCLCIPFFPDRNVLLDRARGNVKVFTYKEIIPKCLDVKISKKVYEKIVDLVDKGGIKSSHIYRRIGDICRFYAVMGYKEEFFKKLLEVCK
jgi:hypothetical protein